MSPDAVVLTVVVLATAPAAAIDLRTRRVPNALTAAVAATGILIAVAGIGRVGPVASMLGLLLGMALMLPGHLFGGTGAGDVKLFAALGTLLGPGAIVTAFLYTAIAGGLLALVVAFQRGRGCATVRAAARVIRRAPSSREAVEHPAADNRFAYVPAISIGVVIAALGY